VGRTDLPAVFLRAEGAVLFGLATFLYWWGEGGEGLLVLLFLAPDLGMLGYLGGPRVGAVVYNLFHTYLPPAVLLVVGLMTLGAPVYWALIWFAHIGLDRMLGFGLKRTSGFRDTHLGGIGSPKARRSDGG
jgi:hypothetical protein